MRTWRACYAGCMCGMVQGGTSEGLATHLGGLAASCGLLLWAFVLSDYSVAALCGCCGAARRTTRTVAEVAAQQTRAAMPGSRSLASAVWSSIRSRLWAQVCIVRDSHGLLKVELCQKTGRPRALLTNATPIARTGGAAAWKPARSEAEPTVRFRSPQGPWRRPCLLSHIPLHKLRAAYAALRSHSTHTLHAAAAAGMAGRARLASRRTSRAQQRPCSCPLRPSTRRAGAPRHGPCHPCG